MSFYEQQAKLDALDKWFSSPLGLAVSQAMTAELEVFQHILCGTRLLQLGHCGSNLWLRSLSYAHKWIVAPYNTSRLTQLTASFNQLPLDRESIDAVIAPLTMSAFTHTHNPIDEIDRILKPMGYAIFFGINPWSFWGMSMRMSDWSCYGSLKGYPMSAQFIKRAMLHRGYTQSNLTNFYYSFPFMKEKWIKKLEILNQLGKIACFYPAGFYCFVAQKYRENYSFILEEDSKKLSSRRFSSLQPVCQLKSDQR